MGRKIRIGIDVGGTFTDAVAMDNEKFEIIGLKKIPTTHDANEGVTRGVIEILHGLLKDINANAEDVVFIAHGTTQATNALLEGDVADIGVVGIGSGIAGAKIRADTDLGAIPLGDGKEIKTTYNYLNTPKQIDKEEAKKIIEKLKEGGCSVVVASEAFSVDNPENESDFSLVAIKNDMLCTCSHEISKLYGLKARTKTAIINASILPKMMQTAEMTSKAVTEANIKSPLMIMRSDGGVMQVNEVKKRPILTVLSGPAAGVAGALMYERISDGIFLEVGGTSTDISAIQNGKVMTKYAKIGGHSTYVTSLDINTIGIGGGSLIRFDNKKIINVGPRSAHIAGLPYVCFEKPEVFNGAKVVSVKATEKDTADFLAIETKEGKRYAVTLTCAANYLGLIKEDDYAHCNQKTVNKEFEIIAKEFGQDAKSIAEDILKIAIGKVEPAVTNFIKEYKLDKNYIILCGGGGGASAVVPFLSKEMDIKFKLAKNAPCISTIGAALAMVRDTVERTIINPTHSDILAIRKEAYEAAIKAGATAETIKVDIEIDSTKNIVKAIAVGTTDINSGKDIGKILSEEEIDGEIKEVFTNTKISSVEKVFRSSYNFTYCVTTEEKKFLGLLKSKTKNVVVIDNRGIIKLNLPKTKAYCIQNDGKIKDNIIKAIEDNAVYDEAGKVIPDVYAVIGGKIVNMLGLLNIEQAVSILDIELNMFTEKEICLLVKKK